jgi:hypothetical protein
MILGLSLVALGSNTTLRGGTDQADDQILATLANHQYDMGNEGRNFLSSEARSHDFVLLGELHGDNEIPTLLKVLWPDMWTQGYRFIAAEVSPWVAHQLEFVPTGRGPKIHVSDGAGYDLARLALRHGYISARGRDAKVHPEKEILK